MSILDVLPHTCTAKVRRTTNDAYGGPKTTYATVFSNRECWQQAASQGEINELDKRGIVATDKIYFTSNVDLTEKHQLTVTNTLSGSTVEFDVVSRSVPDASAGMGVVWKVMVRVRTDFQEDI